MTYVAGFFDGEGSIGVYYRRNTGGVGGFSLRTQLVQNSGPDGDALLYTLARRFGGHITRARSSSGRWKLNWQLTSQSAVALLEKVRPHLRMKRLQADMAIAWQRQRPQRRRKSGRVLRLARNVVRLNQSVALCIKRLKNPREKDLANAKRLLVRLRAQKRVTGL